MNTPHSHTDLFSEIDTLDSLVQIYEDLPPKELKMSAHTQLNYTALEDRIQKSLSAIIKIFNKTTPKHWNSLRLDIVFHSNQSVCIREAYPKNSKIQDLDKGTPLQARPLARFFGILNGLIKMANEPLNDKCQKQWDFFELPERFTKPQPITTAGHQEMLVVDAFSLHDAWSQTSLAFANWSFTDLYKGSQRKTNAESFQDGEKWVSKKFFHYLHTSWMVDEYYYKKIKATKLIKPANIKEIFYVLQHKDVDLALKTIFELLEKVDKNLPIKPYAVYNNISRRQKSSLYYEAHNSEHALAKAMIKNIKYLLSKGELSQHKPEKWEIFLLQSEKNPL